MLTSRRVRGTVAATAAALTATALLSAAPAGASATATSSPSATTAPVAWGDCSTYPAEVLGLDTLTVPPGYQCGSHPVPLDYDKPTGRQVTLALIRRPADDPATRKGSIFVNPGGPGGSGVEIVAAAGESLFGPQVLSQFDIVGMDPRGIAGSQRLTCFADFDELVGFVTANPRPFSWPRTDSDWAAGKSYALGLDAACDRNGASIIDHMSTANVARDMDVLRQAVGDRRLNYVGYSYGSYLGTSYANLFPDKVGSVVVDGVLDPVKWATGDTKKQGENVPTAARVRSDLGARDTFEEFARLCDSAGPQRCAFAGNAAGRYAELLAQLATAPVSLVYPELGIVEPFAVDEQILANVTLAFLYNSGGWAVLGNVLAELERLAGGGSPAPATTDAAQTQAAPAPKPYLGDEGFLGVICSDGVHPKRWNAWRQAVADSTGYFGPTWAFTDNGCVNWPGRDGDVYRGPFTARTSNTVLVASTRFDPATPYAGAQAVRRLLPNSALLTVEGWGHTTSGLSTCGSAVVDTYLLTGRVPARRITCSQDLDPFPAVPSPVGAAGARAAAPGPESASASVSAEVDPGAAAGAALVSLARTGDPATAVTAAAETGAATAEASGDQGSADRLRARQILLDSILRES